jgi:hypothetical protein
MKWTYERIGSEYGYGHSNVLHAIKTVELGYELYQDDKRIIREVWIAIKYNKGKTSPLQNSRYRELVEDMINYDLLSFCNLMTSYKDRTWIYKDLEVTPERMDKIEKEMEKRQEDQKRKEKDSINKTKGNDIGESKRQQIKPQTDGEDTIGVRR